MKLKVLLAFIFGFTPCILLAQTVLSTVNNIKWSLMPTWPRPLLAEYSARTSSGGKYTEGESTGIIKLDENSIISCVQLDANHYGVVRLNKDMSMQWLINIDDYPLAIGIFHDKILVIASDKVSRTTGASNSFTGYLIDPKTSQIIVKKNIYTSTEDFFQQPEFLFAPDGTFFKMTIRTSTLTKKAHFGLAFNTNKSANEYYDSSDFQVLDIDDNLAVKSVIKPVIEDGYFIGATINKMGDVFLMWDYSQGYITVAMYQNGKTKSTKVLKEPVSMDDNIFYSLENNYFFASKDDPMVLYAAMTYKNTQGDKELAIGRFNFKTGTIDHDIQVMDRDYLKQLRKSYVPFNKKFDDVSLGNKYELKIRNIAEDNGKLIVALTSYAIYTTQSTAPATGMTYNSNYTRVYDVLVNVYDNKAGLQFQQIIPRTYISAGLTWLGVGLHCSDNMLYLTVNNDKGFFGYKTLFSQIDLNSGAIVNIAPISKEGISNSYAADPYASLWFGKQLVLSYLENKGLFNSSEDAHLQLINY